jgi:hypothetical protein
MKTVWILELKISGYCKGSVCFRARGQELFIISNSEVKIFSGYYTTDLISKVFFLNYNTLFKMWQLYKMKYLHMFLFDI